MTILLLAAVENRRKLSVAYHRWADQVMLRKARFLSCQCITLVIPLMGEAHIDEISHQDYRGFERNDGQGSCCDQRDCRPALAPFMEKDGKKIMDRSHSKFAFDQSKVVKRPSDDGHWHVCAIARRLDCIIAPLEAGRQPIDFDQPFSPVAAVTLSRPALRPPMSYDIDRELATARICTAVPVP